MATTVDTRTARLFQSVGVEPATRVASGRYLRSEPIRTGSRYRAGHAHGEDLFGIQFYGAGLSLAELYRASLVAAGFEARDRNPRS